MLNNIAATQTLDAKQKFEQPNPVLVAKEQLNVIDGINAWKENPKDRRKHFEYLRTPSNPNMPDDAFYETLKKQLEEQGYTCLLNRKESSMFEVSLPKTPKTPEPLAAETAPKSSATPAAEAKIPAELAVEPPKPAVQSLFDVTALDKKLSTAASQMSNMMKSIYRLLDKNHFKDKGDDGKPDFLTVYTASCVYTLLSQGLDMMRPLLNDLHAAGRLPMTAHLPPFAAFPNKEGRTCNNKRIVLTVCLSMANQNQMDVDVLYLSLNTMFRLLDTVM